MNPSSSKAHRESDPLEDETEDSPSTINLNDGDLRIIVEDNAKSISNSRPSRKHKSDIEQVEEWIDKIKSLSRKSRVKGDLKEYFTCHGCNGFMERRYFLVCGIKECRRYFCLRCANKKFHSSPAEIADLMHETDWMCYSCINMCNCRICKKIYLSREEIFPHQLTKFERAKKRPIVKSEEKDEKSSKSEEGSTPSEKSEPKPEPKKNLKNKPEKSNQASKSEERKGGKKADEKENKNEISKDMKKGKVTNDPKEKSITSNKDKASFVVSKNVEDITKEIKKISKDINKSQNKVEKKVETKKITAGITSKPEKSGKSNDKFKKKISKSSDSEASSPIIKIENSINIDHILEELEKKPSKSESSKLAPSLSKESTKESVKELPKPSKIETVKIEKSKEEEKQEEKKFNRPKIKRELKQLLKMNEEATDFSKLISEDSFEISNSIPFSVEDRGSKETKEVEPKKIVRRFRARPGDVCHICKNIFEKEHMYPCTVPGCDKSFCSFCIQSNFIKDFDPRVFKADQFICYVCGKFCKCKECDKSSYHANKRRARRNEMRMGSSRRGRRMRGRRVIEIRRRKFYDNLPDEYNPNDANNTLDKSFNDDDKMNDYTYDRDLEDEIDDDDQSRSEDSDASDEETRNRFIMRKKRMRKKAIPLKSIQDKLKNTEARRDSAEKKDIEVKESQKQ